jgi:hypothetical protein
LQVAAYCVHVLQPSPYYNTCHAIYNVWCIDKWTNEENDKVPFDICTLTGCVD